MKAKKWILSIVVLVVLAAVVGGLFAFRTQPVMEPKRDYLMHVEEGSGDVTTPGFYLWPQGPDESYETREFVAITAEQEQAVLDILSRYEKQLSWEKVWWVPVQVCFPRAYGNVKAEMPDWVEAQVVLYDMTWGDMDIFNIVLGEGHAQQRQDYTFHPPYYNMENEAQLYEELAQVLDLEGLIAARQTGA